MIGIYKIENLVNGKKYIGQSKDITKRWATEKRVAFIEKDHSYNYPLSRAFRKYGIDNFTFEIIEECSEELLNEREKYWISYYDSFYSGYNQTIGGDNTIRAPKENIIGIIKDLETTDMYHKEIAEKWEVSQETVQGINTGRYWFQKDKSYPLQTKHKNKSRHITNNQNIEQKHYYCKNCGAEITKKATLCIKCSRLASRKVNRPSKEELFNYLKNIKGNFSQAGKAFGVSDNAVRKWCKSYNIPSKSSDYK